MAKTPASKPAPAAVPYPAYPTLQVTHSLVLFCFVFNISGVATILAGVLGRRSLLWKGVFQLLLTPVLAGVIWAIVSQYRIMKNAQAAA